MTMSDLPDKTKTVEIRQVDANQSLPKGYELLDLGPVNGIQKPKVLELDGGFVAHFEVPGGWEKVRNPDRTFSKCRLENNGDVKIRIGDLGIPLAAADCSRMRKFFRSPDQTLSSTDIVFLQQAINYGSLDPILVQSARVHDLNGERVVDFIGRFNWPNEINSSVKCCLLDVDGTTRFVVPITYEAPPAVFNKFLPQAEQIFKSMVFETEHPPFRNR